MKISAEKPTSAAREAREAAGLSLEEAAGRARICAAYLRKIEREGRASWGAARRLSRICKCRMEVYLYPLSGTEERS